MARSRGGVRVTELEKAIRDSGLLVSGLQETGHTLGKGSYGEVIEVRVNGRLCAAKKLHGIFNAQDVPPAEKAAMAERFERECRRVLQLKHPNIVEMIGVHFDRATQQPTLVMELLDISLCSYLETNPVTSVTTATKYSLLLDVATGLVYLHTLSPPLGPIVHRDLTASNILLVVGDKMVAKIADLGQAKNDPAYTAQRHKLSQVPGNEDHMPPEAWLDEPSYNTSLDIFSFGVVMLHTLVHEWPTPLGRLVSATEVRLEVDRRKLYLDQIDGSLLKPLVIECLAQKPEERPVATAVLSILKMGKRCYSQMALLREAHRTETTTLNQQTRSLQIQVNQLQAAVAAAAEDKRRIDSLQQEVDQFHVAAVQDKEQIKSLQQKVDQLAAQQVTSSPSQDTVPFHTQLSSSKPRPFLHYIMSVASPPSYEERDEAKIREEMRIDRRRQIIQALRKIQPQSGKQFKDIEIPEVLFQQARTIAWHEGGDRRFKKVPVYDLLVQHIRHKGGSDCQTLTKSQSVLDGWKTASIALFRYALNLQLAPKRPEFKKMKLSTSFYVYNISRYLYQAERVLHVMGYKPTDKKEGQDLVYEGEVNLVTVLETATDLLVMHEEICLLQDMVQRLINEKRDAGVRLEVLVTLREKSKSYEEAWATVMALKFSGSEDVAYDNLPRDSSAKKTAKAVMHDYIHAPQYSNLKGTQDYINAPHLVTLQTRTDHNVASTDQDDEQSLNETYSIYPDTLPPPIMNFSSHVGSTTPVTPYSERLESGLIMSGIAGARDGLSVLPSSESGPLGMQISESGEHSPNLTYDYSLSNSYGDHSPNVTHDHSFNKSSSSESVDIYSSGPTKPAYKYQRSSSSSVPPLPEEAEGWAVIEKDGQEDVPSTPSTPKSHQPALMTQGSQETENHVTELEQKYGISLTGTWTCPYCTNLVQESDLRCNVCSHHRFEPLV